MKLKTVNINLIGDFGKISRVTRKEVSKKPSSEAGNQVFAMILIIATLISFAASFGGWLLVKKLSSRINQNIIKVSESTKKLEKQEKELNNFRKNLKKEIETTELEISAQNRINSLFLPWSGILNEIAVKIPRDIVVLDIEKRGSREDKEFSLKISGTVPQNNRVRPLTAVSLFIFNLNSGQNSLLCDAKISKLDFNEKTRAYEFEIDASISQTKNLKAADND